MTISYNLQVLSPFNSHFPDGSGLAKLQSNRPHQQINTQFYRLHACHPTNSIRTLEVFFFNFDKTDLLIMYFKVCFVNIKNQNSVCLSILQNWTPTGTQLKT